MMKYSVENDLDSLVAHLEQSKGMVCEFVYILDINVDSLLLYANSIKYTANCPVNMDTENVLLNNRYDGIATSTVSYS